MLKTLVAQPISRENFQPFGQVIWASEDGDLYDPAIDAQLELSQGIPRFYVMRLRDRGLQFHTITRHRRCTQCLGAMSGQSWLLGVAPPSDLDDSNAAPHPEDIAAFLIPGDCFIKLHVGTWHAGPFFQAATVDFYNLELSDTNLTDHHTCNLRQLYGLDFAFELPTRV